MTPMIEPVERPAEVGERRDRLRWLWDRSQSEVSGDGDVFAEILTRLMDSPRQVANNTGKER